VEDSGIFSVIVENAGGSAKSSGNLIVEEATFVGASSAPSFTDVIEDSDGGIHRRVLLKCGVKGMPPIEVYFVKVILLLLPVFLRVSVRSRCSRHLTVLC